MSILNNKIRVSELDFASIKQNFKDYLITQSEFADYDYEASGMSVLMDLLAYNTYYNSVLANYMANETYIDSAQKRDSVVSHAKSLGYNPKSIKSSHAKISMVLRQAAAEPNQLVMKAGTPFETLIREDTYQFVTVDDVIAPLANGQYDFGEFEIFQGAFQQNTFTAEGNKVERFVLPNPFVDVTSIRVYVQNSVSDLDYYKYDFADDIIDVDETSNVFFVQEGITNLIEIYFGDGLIGRQLAAGNIIYVTYITSAGQVTNGAKIFKLTGTIEGNNNVTIKTIEQASGGTDEEDIESIRFNAMTYFGVQNRAVTAGDSKALIMQNFSNVKSLIVWGGEKQDPPEYGKIYVCIEPKNTEFLTTEERNVIIDIIKKRAVANITPTFKDPEYMDLEVTANVYYDHFKNDKSSLELRNIVIDAINNYSYNFLGKFESVFRYSLLSRIIDDSDYGILNNLTSFKLYKSYTPVLYAQNIINMNFYNSILSVSSTGFYVDGVAEKMYLKNEGNNVVLFYYSSPNIVKIYDTVGTVNMNTGLLTLKPMLITKYEGETGIKIYAIPTINDIFSKNNTILKLQAQNIVVNVFDDRTRV